jgi:hypothetical protein
MLLVLDPCRTVRGAGDQRTIGSTPQTLKAEAFRILQFH